MLGGWRAGTVLLVVGTIGLSMTVAAATGLAAGGEKPVTVDVPESAASLGFEVLPKALPAGEPGAARLRLAVEEEAPLGVRNGISAATIGFDRSIELDPRGLPICRWPALESGVQVDAAGPGGCPRAVVGHADSAIELAFPEQTPFKLHSRGKVYSGGVRHGATRLMVELPLGPPVNEGLDLIVPVRHVPEGRIGSEAAIRIPTIAGGYGHLFELRLELGRSFMRRGEPVAYVGAECRDGKLVGTLDASFTDGTKAQSEIIRACTRA